LSTQITDAALDNSTVDNTTVGATTASTARFTTPSSSDNSQNAATTAWCLIGFAASLGQPGYIKLPSWLGGFMIQWGSTGSCANDTPTSIAFPASFATACLAVVATDSFAGSKSATWSTYGFLTSSFTARCDGNTATATYIAVGH
jgi:hypothetical protein